MQMNRIILHLFSPFLLSYLLNFAFHVFISSELSFSWQAFFLSFDLHTSDPNVSDSNLNILLVFNVCV